MQTSNTESASDSELDSSSQDTPDHVISHRSRREKKTKRLRTTYAAQLQYWKRTQNTPRETADHLMHARKITTTMTYDATVLACKVTKALTTQKNWHT